MIRFSRRVLALGICLLAPLLLGASNVPVLPVPPNAAMIYNPGSGDYAGFRIVVNTDGRAIAIDGAGHIATQLQNDLVQKFFGDLSSAGPLDQLSAKPCSEGVSENATTTVEVNSAVTINWKGQHSPELVCATDPRAQKLLLDATEIQHALYVQAYRKRNLLTYGTSYAAAAPPTVLGYVPDFRFSFDQFYSGGFSNTPFTTGQFTFDNFSNGLNYVNPFTGSPYTGAPYSSLPAAGLPGASPFTGLPYASPPFTSPFSGSPYGTNPFTSPGFTTPFASGATYTTSAP
jgi:hypothetical protein